MNERAGPCSRHSSEEEDEEAHAHDWTEMKRRMPNVFMEKIKKCCLLDGLLRMDGRENRLIHRMVQRSFGFSPLNPIHFFSPVFRPSFFLIITSLSIHHPGRRRTHSVDSKEIERKKKKKEKLRIIRPSKHTRSIPSQQPPMPC